MRIMRWVCAASAAGMLLCAQTAFAQDTPQALRQEIDQLRRDFDALKQQYGDRLTALESKLAAAEGQPPAPAAAAQPSANAPQPPAAPPPAEAAASPPAGQQPTAQVPPGAEGAGGPSRNAPAMSAAHPKRIARINPPAHANVRHRKRLSTGTPQRPSFTRAVMARRVWGLRERRRRAGRTVRGWTCAEAADRCRGDEPGIERRRGEPDRRRNGPQRLQRMTQHAVL